MNTSPDGKHKAVLHYKGEIRFGPSYYRLELDGHFFAGRLFGDLLRWSADSHYLAAQEWLTTDDRKGPITRVLLVDLDANRYCTLETVEKGFVEDFRFAGKTFVYRKHFYKNRETTEHEVDMASITKWKRIVRWPRWVGAILNALANGR